MEKTALLIIDVQLGFDDLEYWGGRRNNLGAETNIARLLAGFRAVGQPVIHVRHASTSLDSPLRPERPGHQVKSEAAELAGEPVIFKTVNSAFIGTDLEDRLRGGRIGALVVAGVQTDYCVSTTVRMAGNLGFHTVLVDDACWTYDHRHPDGEMIQAETVHRVNVASLSGEFAEVIDTDTVLSRLVQENV